MTAASDGYQQTKWNRRDTFPSPLCAFKEVQDIELCTVIGAHSFIRYRADADARRRLESAGWTKRLEPAGQTKRGATALCAREGKSRGPCHHRDPYNRADITFRPGTGVVRQGCRSPGDVRASRTDGRADTGPLLQGARTVDLRRWRRH